MLETKIVGAIGIIAIAVVWFYYERIVIRRMHREHEAEIHKTIVRSYNEGWTDGSENVYRTLGIEHRDQP